MYMVNNNMKSLFDNIINNYKNSLSENVTQSDQKAIIDDLNARIASMPPEQKGAIIDLLTSLKDVGGSLAPGIKMPQQPAVTDTTPITPVTPQQEPQQTDQADQNTAEVEKQKQEIENQNKKSAENLARQQTIAAGNQSAGYAKG